MNSNQAREILTLYRPGTDDPASQEFAEALGAVRADAELKLWFDLHCASFETLRARFQAIAVPEGLKEQIISERKVRTSKAFRKTVSLYAGVAALLILMAATFYSQRRSEDAFASFQSRMAGSVLRDYPHMDLETSDLNRIRKFLADNSAHGDYVLPSGLSKATSTGCAVLQWHGKTVSMICFNSGVTNSPSPDLYLFVIDRSAVTDPPAVGDLTSSQKAGLAMASWTSNGKTYLLAGLGNNVFLKKFE